jgi:L,D-transpeptidase catalytic domain
MILKKLVLVFLMLFPVSVISTWAADENHDSIPYRLTGRFVITQTTDSSELPSLKLLQTALAGYEMLIEEKSISRPEVITIIDFSLPSDKERLWVLDIIHGKVLFRCLVSHGRNSGELMAENFSNIPGSCASSPGFYTTGETYIGKHGLSLTLDGREMGINDKARARTIVIHGANYVSADFIRKYGRLGRSFGCPAVPEELSKEIIQTIKGGSCLFIYVPKISYISNSQIIRKITSITKG